MDADNARDDGDAQDRARRRRHDIDNADADAGDDLADSVNRTISDAQPADGEKNQPGQ
jgi:hypothetical protein